MPYEGLITAILRREIKATEIRTLTPTSLSVAALVAREAHRLGLDGVVLAIDNDGNPTLHETHDPDPASSSKCRYCLLCSAARIKEVRSWPRPALPPLGFVFGVPVQMIETWLLLAKGHPFTGDHRAIGRVGAERRMLKKWLYGSEAPSRETMERVAREVTSAMNAAAVETASRSFALFSAQVRVGLGHS